MRRAVDAVLNSIGTVLMVAAALAIAFPVSLWLYDRDPPVEIADRHLEKLQASPGDDLCVMTEFIRTKNCETFASQFVLDSSKRLREVQATETLLTTSPIGELTERRSCYTVPLQADVGPAQLIFAARDQCNIIHSLFWPINREPESYPFEIVAAGSK